MQVKSEFSQIKVVFIKIVKHHQAWDQDYAAMSQKSFWCDLPRPYLLGPWEASHPHAVPPSELMPDLIDRLKSKLVIARYVEEHTDELPYR